jgi:hypothetical protein
MVFSRFLNPLRQSPHELRYVGNPTYLQMAPSFIFAGPRGDLPYFYETTDGDYVG